jgi:hypothetical protein
MRQVITMSTRRRHGLGIDEEAYQKALDDLKRLLDEGDDSDTTMAGRVAGGS